MTQVLDNQSYSAIFSVNRSPQVAHAAGALRAQRSAAVASPVGAESDRG